VKQCTIGVTGTKFILETAGDDSLCVLGIHEAKIKFGQYEFNHSVIVANTTDYVLKGLNLMEQKQQNSVMKSGRDETSRGLEMSRV